jgi:hypothetical protein
MQVRAEKAESELAAAKAERDLAITRLASILWSGAIDKRTCGDVQQWADDYTAELARLRAENDEMRVQIEANKRKGGGCQCADDEACAHVRRAEKAEAQLHDLNLDLLTANHMIKLERDRADTLQARLNEIDAMLKSPDLID